MFEAKPEHVKGLDKEALADLMRRLLLAEALRTGISLSDVTVPLQIDVPDGGEDGRIDWSGGVPSTPFLPSRFCILQSKATRLGPAQFRSEVWRKGTGKTGRKGKPGKPAELIDAAKEVIDRSGSYIVFTSAPMIGRAIAAGEDAIRSGIAEAGGDPKRCTAIKIYDANKIANWVNQHPSVTIWLIERATGRSLAGFQSYTEWSKAPDLTRAAWIDDGAPRFAIEAAKAARTDEKATKGSVLTFSELAVETGAHLANPRRILRIAGPSGFGKTRSTHQLFGEDASLLRAINRNAIIYADMRDVGDRINQLALDLSNRGASALLVVDECPDDQHRRLSEIAGRAGSELRLVTLDTNTHVQASTSTMVVRLRPASDDLIVSIAKQIGGRLTGTDIDFIKRLADGFPRMAVAAADALGEHRDPLRTVDELIDRIVWGRAQPDLTAEKSLQTASMFDVLGVDGKARDDLEFVGQLAGVSADTMYEHLMLFEPRGIVVRRGDYIQVQPLPLAARLAARRLSLLDPKRRAALLDSAPPSLFLRFLTRLRWLDTSEHARDIARSLLAPGAIGNIDRLNTKHGSKCLDHLVHVDPDLAMATLDRVFANQTDAALERFDAGRWYVVQALEKLVFRRKTFISAARLLLRLASAETARGTSDGATSHFKRLFQAVLSGTEAEPALRIAVLDEGLRSSNPRIREICVDALNSMLSRRHFMRPGGNETIGSQRPLKDWRPKNSAEALEFHREGLRRLTAIACSDDVLSKQARAHLASSIRALMSPPLFDEIRSMISKVQARAGFWIGAVRGVNSWLFYDRKDFKPEFGQQVRKFYDELLPTDLSDLALLYTSGWSIDLHDPDTPYNEERGANDHHFTAKQAGAVAVRAAEDDAALSALLERMIGDPDLHSTAPFWQQVAKAVKDPIQLFDQAVRVADRTAGMINLGPLSGVVLGASQRGIDLGRKCVARALKSPKLRRDALRMIGHAEIDESDLTTVSTLLKAGDIEPADCVALSYGRGLDHIEPQRLIQFLDDFDAHGAAGVWSELEILELYVHGRDEAFNGVAPKIKALLGSPHIIEPHGGRRRDGHLVADFYLRLERNGHVDEAFARALLAQLLRLVHADIKTYHAFDTAAEAVLRSLALRFPDTVWDAFAGAFERGTDEYRLLMLLGSDREDPTLGGPLSALPTDLWLVWARQSPSERMPLVLSWLPIVVRSADGPQLAWHPIVEMIVAQFGEHDGILDELAAQMYPRSYRGSVVPYLEPYLPLVEGWFNHPLSRVRMWAQETHERLRDRIERERKRDAERDLGIF